MKKKLLIIIPLLHFAASLKAQVARVPFEFDGKHLYIKIKTPNSDTLRFAFDTGAASALIDSATAENAGVSKNNRQVVSVAGSGGVKDYTMAVNQTLKLSGIDIDGMDLILMNFSQLSTRQNTKFDGIIGYEILNKYITNIDFDHRTLSLYNDIKETDTSGYTRIPFEFSRNVMIPRFPISITVANKETFTGRVMFDTGSPYTLVVSTPFSKFHDFENKLGKTSLTAGGGINAKTIDKLATIKSMHFNGFNFDKMGIRLTVNENAEPRDGNLGILGNEIIKRFNVILDYKNKVIYLKSNSLYQNKF